MAFRMYYKVIKMLRNEMPPKLPVRVRRVKIDNEGYCEKDENRFSIRIKKNLKESEAIDVLLHEWAHALSWKASFDRMSYERFCETIHGPEWGVAYSKVYQLFEKHFT
jgi:hypothetical protein